MLRYEFTEGVPVAFGLLFGLTIINFLGWFGVMGWADFYGPLQPMDSFIYPVHFSGGVQVYVPAILGHYIEWGLYLHLVLLLVMGGLCWYYWKTGRMTRAR